MEVENEPIVKETSLGGTHGPTSMIMGGRVFPEPWAVNNDFLVGQGFFFGGGELIDPLNPTHPCPFFRRD